MALVEVFQHKRTGQIVVSPFAADPELGAAVDRASGPLTRLSPEEFKVRGVECITEHLKAFYTRDGYVKSELYQVMSEKDRRKFLSEHDMLNIALSKGASTAKVYVGEQLDFYGEVPFPFDKATFADYVLEAFAKQRQV